MFFERQQYSCISYHPLFSTSRVWGKIVRGLASFGKLLSTALELEASAAYIGICIVIAVAVRTNHQ